MKDEGPFRNSNNPKPEQIVEFYDTFEKDSGKLVLSCLRKANVWLRNRAGSIKIIRREVAVGDEGRFTGILVWYREL